MEELKPCHVCGATQGLYVLEDYDSFEWYVFCDNCKTSVHSEYALIKEEAIKTWNTRHERTVKLKDNGHCPDCRKLIGTGENYCSWCGAKIEH